MLLLVVFVVVSLVCVGDDDSVEYQVKVVFFCKFGNYIEWLLQMFVGLVFFCIGVFGGELVVEELCCMVVVMMVVGYLIEVYWFECGELFEGLYVVFLMWVMVLQVLVLLNVLQGWLVLIVIELELGGLVGIINFVVVDDKVCFDILLLFVVQSGFKISVCLLSVVWCVEGRFQLCLGFCFSVGCLVLLC